MVSQGQRLAQVQLDGHRAIDAVYQPLSIAVAAAIMRRATPDANGILRLSLPARFAILTDVGRLLDAARIELFSVIIGAIKGASEAAQADVAPLPRDLADQMEGYRATALALRTDRASVISQTGALLIKGIAAGGLASRGANQVRQYFSPWFSQYRSETGKRLHTDRLGAIRHWPGQAGMASAHPRSVMLTETTAAHARATKAIAERDQMGLKWSVSAGHSEADECDDNAQRSSRGQAPGVYLPSEFPKMPTHPRCRCVSSIVPLATR